MFLNHKLFKKDKTSYRRTYGRTHLLPFKKIKRIEWILKKKTKIKCFSCFVEKEVFFSKFVSTNQVNDETEVIFLYLYNAAMARAAHE